MEAVPAVVAVSKVVGGGGGGGVTVMEVEARSDRISIVVSPSIDGCSPFVSQKDKMCVPSGPGSTFNKTLGTEFCKQANQISNFHPADAAGDVKFGSRNNSPLPVHSLEGKLLQSKTGKMARSSSSGSYKRSRMSQMEETLQEAEVNDSKGKNHMAKQKNGVSGKRSDRRKCRVVNSKCDYFSLKASAVSFNSSPGGNNFFDTNDVTKHLDDLSLSDLLDGDYKSPSFAKDKGKKSTSSNENILQSISKACSVLRLHKPLQTQKSNECDHSYNQKPASSLVNSETTVASKNVNDDGGAPTFDKVQESCSNTISPAEVPDSPLLHPKDILERLALPPAKDLDSILLDAAKPHLSSRSNSDSRIKHTSHKATLSPFPWSHNTGTNCKTNADALKISSSKTTCQGRWAKMGNVSSSLEKKTCFLTDLESLNYDQKLVPLGSLPFGPSEIEMLPSSSLSIPPLGPGSSPSVACPVDCPPIDCHRSLSYDEDEYSPRLLSAAQTLCDIRWPKKRAAETTLKVCKTKSNTTKSVERFAGGARSAADHHHINSATEFLPLKKSRHSMMHDKSKAAAGTAMSRETPPSSSWSLPRSSTRPSPNPSSFRDSFPASKPNNANAAKRFCLMPPPTSRVIDKACSSRQKSKKSTMEWTRGGNLN